MNLTLVFLGVLIAGLSFAVGALNIQYFLVEKDPKRFYILAKGLVCIYFGVLYTFSVKGWFLIEPHNIPMVRIAIFCLMLLLFSDAVIRRYTDKW